MSEEWFDVVNDANEVVGRLPRSEVHRRGLKHRAVHVLVFNGAGQVFLQKRSMQKDTHPGVWDSSASGHLDSGESYDDCVLREVREEIGLELQSIPEELMRIDACEATGQEFVRVYRCEAEGPFTLHPDEIESGGWFSTKAVSRSIAESPEQYAPAFVLIWQQLEPASR